MSAKAVVTEFPVQAFASAADFETFLETHHTTAPGLYVKFAKKASGIPSISGAEAVEVALCFGWIDGRGNSVDDKWFTVRYTPRRAKSIWSQKNVATVARLVNEGRMRPAGIAAVEAAKADGRWDRAYAGPATIKVPEDLATALAATPTAQAFFEGLNKRDRYSVLWRIETASPANRENRIATLVQMLAEGQTPHEYVKPENRIETASKIKKSTPKKAVPVKSSSKRKVSLGQTDSKKVLKPSLRTGLRSRK